jgi:FG-GAP-like repeat
MGGAEAGRALAADFDRDGVLESVRYGESSLTLGRGRDQVTIELDQPLAEVQALDLEHDGNVDLWATTRAGRARRVAAGRPAFAAIWDSGEALGNVWDAAAGSLDGDAAMDFVSVAWPQPSMRVFESAGDDAFAQVFSTMPSEVPGAYVTVATADSDGDGAQEILGGETSTLNQIVLYEATGDGTYTRRPIDVSEPDPFGFLSMDKVMVADADGDGRKEILFDTSSSTGEGSMLFVYEHDGVEGSNEYSKVFTHTSLGYMVDFTVGDSDNDGKQEIVLAFGGFLGGPVVLERLENTGDDQFEHKQVETAAVGLALAPTVADVDGDGANELIFAAATEQGGGLFIFESVADDTYELIHSEGGLAGNAQTSTVGTIGGSSKSVIAIGSHEGDVRLWRHGGSGYQVVGSLPALTGAIRSIDLAAMDGDEHPDILVSEHGGGDRVHLFEQARD